jgi:telomere length regulation protein
VNVQILLLCAGIAHRRSPSFLARLARSSTFLGGVSNRLGASSHRARFLGMVVGECFSSLVDKEAKMVMSFGTEDMETIEGKWWKSIPMIDDSIGELKDLFSTSAAVVKKRKPSPPAAVPTTTTIQVINEEEEEESSDDEFTPYAPPDSDPEDAPDEDATTIDRNKPSAPVYIRQLISYLHATDSYDKQALALQHGSSLIRRKTSPGSKELTTHLPELLSIFAGIDNRFDIPSFDELRTAALVSLVVAAPEQAGPWLAAHFFTGDYGLSQRATLLTAIGRGARELAALDPAPTITTPMLPEKSHLAWSSSSSSGNDLTAITSSLKSLLLTPLAAKAADQVTGPAVLKVRTFSSRLAVEKKRGAPVHRKILDVVAGSFFFPLVGGWWVAAKDYGGKQVQAEPMLLSLMLQTIAVLIHAAGPAAPRGMEMAQEAMELVVGLLPPAIGANEKRVLEALLLVALTVLEVAIEARDGARRVAEEMGAQVVEVKGWAEVAVEAGEEDVRALAAGVLVKIAEVEEGYRRVLLGGLGIEE